MEGIKNWELRIDGVIVAGKWEEWGYKEMEVKGGGRETR